MKSYTGLHQSKEFISLLILYSIINIPDDGSGSIPPMNLVVVIDSLSSAAQRITPLLTTLMKVVPVNLTLILNPQSKLSEMPLKE